MNLKNGTLEIRKVSHTDLEALWKVSYQDNLEWMQWNGPYFNDPVLSHDEFVESIAPRIYVDADDVGVVIDNGKIIGMVTSTFIDNDLKRWLEFGVVIYDPAYWGHGLGTKTVALWIDYLFTRFPDLPHLGFTTWSGNLGMMAIGEKLGMTLEARIRQVRYTRDQYWDSIKYGILRDEFYNQ